MGISWFRKVLREIFVWLGIGLNTNTKPDKICEQCEGESPETTFDLQGGERLIEAVVPHNVGNASPTHYPSGPKPMRGWVDTGQGGGARGTARSLSSFVCSIFESSVHLPSPTILQSPPLRSRDQLCADYSTILACLPRSTSTPLPPVQPHDPGLFSAPNRFPLGKTNTVIPTTPVGAHHRSLQP